MSCSPAQMLLGNEIIAMVKQYLKGAEFNPDTLATETIEEVGPGGQFIAKLHTLKYLRKSYWKPIFFDRQSRSNWENRGAKTQDKKII
jgi:trimethylamine--corrinoid protein Co-methyltransferase